MAYEKQTWSCGDTITADKLNHIEDGIEEASQGGGDAGYTCTEGIVTVFEGNVTTGSSPYSYAFGAIAYEEMLPQSITVTFEGVKYELERNGNYYGDGDHSFSNYPFEIDNYEYSGTAYTGLYTPSAGTYSLKIETIRSSVITTPCFESAVKSVVAQEGNDHPIELFNISQTGQDSWTPSIEAHEMYQNLASKNMTYVGIYGTSFPEFFYLSNIHDAGYGTTCLEFNCVRTDGSNVKIKTFKFLIGGGSSYEEKTLTVQ